jgi:hypothetical protein
MRCVDWNPYNIQTRSYQEFINLGWTNCPHVVQRIGLVRPVKKLWRAIGIAVQRLILQIRIILAPECEPLPVRQVRIKRKRVLSLIVSVESRGKPVAVAANEIREVWNRPGIQNTEPVRTYAILRNDIALEATIRVEVAGRNDLPALRGRGGLRVSDEDRYLVAG